MRKYFAIGILILCGCSPHSPHINPCEDYVGPPPVVSAVWAAPSNPVAYYVLELSVNGKEYVEIATTENEFYHFNGEVEFCNTYKCRVTSVSENGNKSGPSKPSLRYDPIPKENK